MSINCSNFSDCADIFSVPATLQSVAIAVIVILYFWCVSIKFLLATLQAEENLGMAMIFTLVTTVQEKLDEIVDVIKDRREEEKRRKDKEAEEAEKVETKKLLINMLTVLLWW